MRRIESNNLPRFLRSGETPPKDASEEPGPWRASFELRSITPILGGGVQSFEPDAIDIVRVPAIRGHLRWWWRGLYQKWDDSASSAVADALFTREAQLWGGVGVPGQTREGAKESPGLRSRVRITVEIVSPGIVGPAGRHQWGDHSLKAVPDWHLGTKLGYALFPLQRTNKERQEHEQKERFAGRSELPTRAVRKDLRFRLHLAVTGATPGAEPEKADIVQVLGAVWAWTFFGGLGSRTRRGFGALEPKEPIEISQLEGVDREAWLGVFRGPGKRGLLGWLDDLEQLAAPTGRLWPFKILVGRHGTDAASAHADMVSYMKYFRQAPGFARDPGVPTPGQSRWPEPHLLRVLAPPGISFEHKPSEEVARAVDAGAVGAPRAAFGLPIQVQFKRQDVGDTRANATFAPPGAQRWPSPVLLRALRRENGEYCPAAVLLPLRPPSEVSVKFTADPDNQKTCAVAKSAGAREAIGRLLKTARGDALQAFEDWLMAEKKFQPISLPEKGGSHA